MGESTHSDRRINHPNQRRQARAGDGYEDAIFLLILFKRGEEKDSATDGMHQAVGLDELN